MRTVFKCSTVFITAFTVMIVCLAAVFAEEVGPTPAPTAIPVPMPSPTAIPIPTPAPTAIPVPTPTPAPSDYDRLQEELDRIYDRLESLYDQQYIPPAPDPPAPTEKPAAAPMVKVLSPQTVTLAAGGATDAIITLKNVGTSHAYSVLTQAVPTGDGVLTIMFLNNSNSIQSVSENNEAKVTMRINADKSAKPGTYSIEITNSYRDMYAVNHSQTDSIIVKVENPGYSAGLLLKNFSVTGDAITPGSPFTLNVTLSNSSPFDVAGVQVDIEGLTPEGINMTGISNIFRSSVPAGHEETLSYGLSSAKKASAGSYPLTFTLKYKDPAGAEQSTTYTYYVSIISGGESEEEDDNKANVEFTSLEGPPDIYMPGQTFGVQLSIANNGDAAARNVKVTADGGESILPMSASIKLFNRMAAGESENMQFYFAADEDAKTQTHMIRFTLSYETGNKIEDKESTVIETITLDQYVGASIYNPPTPTPTLEPTPTPEVTPDPNKINKPKMIISGYKTNPEIVSAGKSFTLSIDFQNTHRTKIVSNLKIVLSTESTGERGSVFSPLDSGNTIFISDIPPGGVVNKTLAMMSAPDAQPRSYSLSAKFYYQDDEFLEYEEEEQIGITVMQVIRLEISDLELPPDGYIGEPLELYCNIINSGRVSLNNLRVRVESEGMDTAGAGMYFGRLSDGSSMLYDAFITPQSAGAVKCKLIISGEDDAGVVTELSQDFEVQIHDFSMEMGMFDYEDYDMYPYPNEETGFIEGVKTFFLQYWIWVSAGAALIIVIVIVIIRKRRRRRQRGWDDE